jgi:mannitol/fructose-specific phosphotransferase system IIA component (Ntr-type)
MTFADILSPASVLAPLDAATREDAVERLVEALGCSAGAADALRLRDAVLARELAGSTGIGAGVAIPHARTPGLKAPRLAVGRAERPLDFKSADGQPVTLVFLLAVPESDPKSHLKVLAALSRLAGDKKLLRALHKADGAAGLFAALSALPV